MIYDVIQLLLVLIEKLVFFSKPLQGFIVSLIKIWLKNIPKVSSLTERQRY